MVVKRLEIEQGLTRNDQEVFRKIEAALDYDLMERWTGVGEISVCLPVSKMPRKPVLDKLLHRYREAGWSIRFREHFDQRDGFDLMAEVSALSAQAEPEPLDVIRPGLDHIEDH